MKGGDAGQKNGQTKPKLILYIRFTVRVCVEKIPGGTCYALVGRLVWLGRLRLRLSLLRFSTRTR